MWRLATKTTDEWWQLKRKIHQLAGKSKLDSPTTQLTILIDLYGSCEFRRIGCSEYAWCWNIPKNANSRMKLQCSADSECLLLETLRTSKRSFDLHLQYSRYIHDTWRYSTINVGQQPYVGASKIRCQYKILRKSSKACWSRLSSYLDFIYALLYLTDLRVVIFSADYMFVTAIWMEGFCSRTLV